jgi:hypothetical protein
MPIASISAHIGHLLEHRDTRLVGQPLVTHVAERLDLGRELIE